MQDLSIRVTGSALRLCRLTCAREGFLEEVSVGRCSVLCRGQRGSQRWGQEEGERGTGSSRQKWLREPRPRGDVCKETARPEG